MTKPDVRSTRIALIGYRGAGKTVVGREIARITGRTHVDTDEMIASKSDRTIAEIFKEEGEEEFRKLEAEAVEAAVRSDANVISVGGGAVLLERNRKLLSNACFVVYLSAPAEVLWPRIEHDPQSREGRPTLGETGRESVVNEDKRGEELVSVHLATRDPLYRETAHHIVDASLGTPEAIAQQTISASIKWSANPTD